MTLACTACLSNRWALVGHRLESVPYFTLRTLDERAVTWSPNTGRSEGMVRSQNSSALCKNDARLGKEKEGSISIVHVSFLAGILQITSSEMTLTCSTQSSI